MMSTKGAKTVKEQHVHLFLKSNGGRTLTWHDLAPGDSAQLVRGVPNGEVVINREEVVLQKR